MKKQHLLIQDVYAIVKNVGEAFKSFKKTRNLNFTIFRFNTYGPLQSDQLVIKI